MDKLYYLASPYTKYPGGVFEAERIVSEKAADLLLQGYNVFAPISMSHAIEQRMPEIQSGDFWLKLDFSILERCDELLVYQMPGWEDSYGVTEEISFATSHNIPITYLPYEPSQH